MTGDKIALGLIIVGALALVQFALQLAAAFSTPKEKPMSQHETVFALVDIQNEFAGQLLIRDAMQPGESKWIGGVRKLGRHGSATLIELPRWKAETYGLTVLKAREIGGAVSQTA